jgi:hypothetical protein
MPCNMPRGVGPFRVAQLDSTRRTGTLGGEALEMPELRCGLRREIHCGILMLLLQVQAFPVGGRRAPSGSAAANDRHQGDKIRPRQRQAWLRPGLSLLVRLPSRLGCLGGFEEEFAESRPHRIHSGYDPDCIPDRGDSRRRGLSGFPPRGHAQLDRARSRRFGLVCHRDRRLPGRPNYSRGCPDMNGE